MSMIERFYIPWSDVVLFNRVVSKYHACSPADIKVFKCPKPGRRPVWVKNRHNRDHNLKVFMTSDLEACVMFRDKETMQHVEMIYLMFKDEERLPVGVAA